MTVVLGIALRRPKIRNLKENIKVTKNYVKYHGPSRNTNEFYKIDRRD